MLDTGSPNALYFIGAAMIAYLDLSFVAH